MKISQKLWVSLSGWLIHDSRASKFVLGFVDVLKTDRR